MLNEFKKVAQKGKKLVVVGAGAIGFGAVNANAALTASDVDFSPALADLSVVFLAIIGVTITIFGYKKILALLGRG